MEQLALIGVSHKRGGAAALEAWQSTFSLADEAPRRAGFSEWVPIITCNRCDLVVALPKGMDALGAREALAANVPFRPYAYGGDGALEQLTRIATSLDSLNPGEDQIMAQVRGAFAAAQAAGSVGPTTHFAFQTALKIAKKVRREVPLAPLNTSLFSLARPELERVLPHGGTVAVLGAGEMGALAAKSLSAQAGVELIVVNRSVERARQLAKHLGAKSSSLEAFLAAPSPVDALVCATPVRGIVDRTLVQLLPDLKLIVDLGLPRNVHSEVLELPNLRVLDVDTLQDAGKMRRETLYGRLAEAEALMQRELDSALEGWTERQLGPSITKLRQHYLDTVRRTLPDMSAGEAERLAHRFARVPVQGLRAVARSYGLGAAETFLGETLLGEAGLSEIRSGDAAAGAGRLEPDRPRDWARE